MERHQGGDGSIGENVDENPIVEGEVKMKTTLIKNGQIVTAMWEIFPSKAERSIWWEEI